MEEKGDVPTGTKVPGTSQCNSEDLSDTLMEPMAKGDFIRLQIDFYKKDMESTRSCHNIYGKPYILPSSLLP